MSITNLSMSQITVTYNVSNLSSYKIHYTKRKSNILLCTIITNLTFNHYEKSNNFNLSSILNAAYFLYTKTPIKKKLKNYYSDDSHENFITKLKFFIS